MTLRIDRRVLPGLILLFILAGLSLLLWSATKVIPIAIFFVFIHSAFFRDPERKPAGDGVLSPADGKVVEISVVDEPRFMQGRAIKIGIFLSVFDVHVNRMPGQGTLDWQEHVPGQFLNAMSPDSSVKNEANWLGFKEGNRKFLVRQISGLIARHIHWDIKTGETLARGAKIGMICYGSRTELYLPEGEFETSVHLGDVVKSAETVMGTWKK